jgi:hypothetical protein
MKMAVLKKSLIQHIEFGNYNYKSAPFITKAASITVLSGILAFLNFVPPGTLL